MDSLMGVMIAMICLVGVSFVRSLLTLVSA